MSQAMGVSILTISNHLKKLDKWLPHELNEIKELVVFKCVRCSFYGTRKIHVLIEWRLETKNGSLVTIVSYRRNELIMPKHSNIFQNQNCINRRLWLSGGHPLALSITAFWNLTRAPLPATRWNTFSKYDWHWLIDVVQFYSWQCSARSCQDDNAWPHADDDSAKAHWYGISDFPKSTILSWSSNHRLPFFQVSRHFFYTKRHSNPKKM